jgi:hypothetical protein
MIGLPGGKIPVTVVGIAGRQRPVHMYKAILKFLPVCE